MGAGRKPAHRVVPGLDTRAAVWEALRGFSGAFGVRDAAEQTRLGVDTVREYLTGLAAAGYLEEAGTLPVRGRPARAWRLPPGA
ncbi:MAG: hypothetical protein AB1578_21740, partial [Thermodesulfobacteriota bacterium]